MDKTRPDPKKVFEAVARIIGQREGVEVTVKKIVKKEGTKEAESA